MLSYWCCKGKLPSRQGVNRTDSRDFPNAGSFENPLCCPCYLCACCGGLGKLSSFQLWDVSFTRICQLVWNALDVDYVQLGWRLDAANPGRHATRR